MSSTGSRILQDLRIGNYRLTRHCKERMNERAIMHSDVSACAAETFLMQEQPNGAFKIAGYDCEGNPICLIAAWDGETVLITVTGDDT